MEGGKNADWENRNLYNNLCARESSHCCSNTSCTFALIDWFWIKIAARVPRAHTLAFPAQNVTVRTVLSLCESDGIPIQLCTRAQLVAPRECDNEWASNLIASVLFRSMVADSRLVITVKGLHVMTQIRHFWISQSQNAKPTIILTPSIIFVAIYLVSFYVIRFFSE